jgi:hypothetical protein
LRFMRSKSRLVTIWFFFILIASSASGHLVLNGTTQATSNYSYRFNVDRKGFTKAEINFSSTEISGESWVFVPRNESSWHITVTTPGQIEWNETVETNQVIDQNIYFYRALRFRYRSNGSFFNMTIRFDFDNGALILEHRGIFYSPQIGFEASSDGNAEVLFDSNFQIEQDLAVVVGSSVTYPPQKVESDRVLFKLQENVVRLQVELGVTVAAEETTLRSSDNRTFMFKTASQYQEYAESILRFYDRIYNQTARLFNVTLEDVVVQWFLPDFESLLSVGGFVPVFTGGLGEININVVFIRTVNGTVEDIAAHELVHRFLGKAGISPNEFLWLHEGMAQYISVNIVSGLGYEGAETERENLENSATSLVQFLGGEHFDSIGLQRWSPSYQPSNADVSSLYAASYYVVSRLPQVVKRDGFEYYRDFFELVGELPSGFDRVKVKGISELALYLSQAANASVASTLKRWGFTVADLYESPVQDLITEAGRAVNELNPVFQPYRFMAEYLYQQALLSAETGDWDRAQSLLQLSISLANLAPLLTLLTIAALLALLAYVLARRSRRQLPPVPPPPPEIMQSST